MSQLENRVAIVTGAALGIGNAIAQRYIEEGAQVVIAELNEQAGRIAAEKLGEQAVFIHTDASSKESVENMVAVTLDRFGRVDILVNNAWGGGTISRLENKTPNEMEHGVAMGFLGPFWTMVAVHPSMKANRYGRIVNVCSLNGVNAHVGTADYNAGKEALRAVSRTAAREWAGDGITCNVLCPGAKSNAFMSTMAEHPELIAAADSMNPMGRIGDCYDDISPVALFLASDGCRYMTGNTLFIDGGAHINGVSWAPELGD